MTDKQRKANLVESYGQKAEERNRSETQDWKVVERASFLSLLQRENKHSLLEIGAGPGRDSLFFHDQGLKVTCIDLSPKMIELCLQKGLDAHIMDMVHLDFEQDTFDAVYALNSFLHLSKNEFPVALKNVRTVLQPGGLFYLGMYGGYDFEGIWEDDSYIPKRFFSFYTDDDLKRALNSLFEIVYFRNLEFDRDQTQFQSIILRKNDV